MTALAPAFHSVDHIAGINLNYRKCCWVQYGTEGRESLWHWLSENCGEFRENAKRQTRQVCWNHDWPRWTHSLMDGTPEKSFSAC